MTQILHKITEEYDIIFKNFEEKLDGNVDTLAIKIIRGKLSAR